MGLTVIQLYGGIRNCSLLMWLMWLSITSSWYNHKRRGGGGWYRPDSSHITASPPLDKSMELYLWQAFHNSIQGLILHIAWIIRKYHLPPVRAEHDHDPSSSREWLPRRFLCTNVEFDFLEKYTDILLYMTIKYFHNNLTLSSTYWNINIQVTLLMIMLLY